MINKGIRILIWGFLFLFGWGTIAIAADYPQKPIRMIIPFSAGGGNDVLCRAFQPAFEKALGQRILIENIPGGSSKVGTMQLVTAKPDGYTLLFATGEAMIGYYYSKSFDSKVWEDLVPVAGVTSEPYGFLETRIESPFKTWADVAKAAKENPGKLSCGGPGAGGMMELIWNDITKAAGIKTQYVPFAGGGPSKIAMLGGHVDFRLCQPAESIAMIRAGKTRGLVVSNNKRMDTFPDVPTFKELGIGGSVLLSRAVFGPPKLPSDLINAITKAIEKASKDPEFIKVAREQLLCDVDFKPLQRMREQLRNFDKEFGLKLAEMYK